MIDDAIKNFLDSRNIPRLGVEGRQEYADVLNELGVHPDSDLADFFLSYDEVEFSGELYQMLHICWFYINTSDYDALLKNLWYKRPWGKLPKNFIPLSFFQGEKVFIYDTTTNSVYFTNESEITLIIDNGFTPQWSDFNLFLHWFLNI